MLLLSLAVIWDTYIFDLSLINVLLFVLNQDVLQTSIIFAFESLLTLFIPFLILLFEKRDEFNSLDKKLIVQISQIRISVGCIIGFLCLHGLRQTLPIIFTNLIAPLHIGINLISISILIYLADRLLKILQFILNRDAAREELIRESDDDHVLEYFEDFFLSSPQSTETSTLITRRQTQTIFSKETKMLNLSVEKINKGINIIDSSNASDGDVINFVVNMLDILRVSSSTINSINITKPLSETTTDSLLDKILDWHFSIWKQIHRHRSTYPLDTINNILDIILQTCIKNILTNNPYNISGLFKKIQADSKERLEINRNTQHDGSQKDITETYYKNLINTISISFFDNLTASQNWREINGVKDVFFPKEWKIKVVDHTKTHEIDKTTDADTYIATLWQKSFLQWIDKNSHYLYTTYGTEEAIYYGQNENPALTAIELLFPDTDHRYISQFLIYAKLALGMSAPRIEDFITHYKMVSYSFNSDLDFRTYTEIDGKKVEIEQDKKQKRKKAQNNAIKIIIKLNDYTIDYIKTHLEEDHKKIKKLRQKSQSLTPEQKQTLNTISEIWSKLAQELQTSIRED